MSLHQRTLSASSGHALPHSQSSTSVASNASSSNAPDGDDAPSERSQHEMGAATAEGSPSSDNRRTRALLAQFYGIGKQSSDSKKQQQQADEFNVNSGAFSAPKYVRKLVRENGLNGLMKKDVDIASRTFVYVFFLYS